MNVRYTVFYNKIDLSSFYVRNVTFSTRMSIWDAHNAVLDIKQGFELPAIRAKPSSWFTLFPPKLHKHSTERSSTTTGFSGILSEQAHWLLGRNTTNPTPRKSPNHLCWYTRFQHSCLLYVIRYFNVYSWWK